METKLSKKNIFHIAGAFIAWVIGSGFATGQEVLQFFSSFGSWSYGVVGINLIGFMVVGYFLMKTGFEHKTDGTFHHFQYFCGKRLGTVYSWLTTGTLMLLIPVLLSGAGATLYEYYGINKYLGSAVMALFVLTAYLIGFERLIKIVSSVGPIIIAFSLLVGSVTVLCDYQQFENVPEYAKNLSNNQSAPNWILSAILYLGLNFFPGSTYFTQLGRSSFSKKELRYGAVIGASVLILSITIMSTAILLNGNATARLDIPVLYLARKLSYVLGAVFSITLILGIFSSCSVMMWSVCSRFTFGGKRGNVLCSVGIISIAYIISLFSFGRLVSVFYPIVGYIGLIFIGCVIYKGVKKC